MKIPWVEIVEQLGYKSRDEMFLVMYKDMGCQAIADQLGVYKSVVQYHLNKLGVEMRPPGGPNHVKSGKYSGQHARRKLREDSVRLRYDFE